MNAFFGFIQLNSTETYFDKNKKFVDTVFSKFPKRFSNKKIIEHKNITLVGDVESFYANQETTEEKSLFFIGEIYNKQEIERMLNILSTNNNALLAYELIMQKGLQAVETINGQFIIIYIDNTQQKIYLLNDQMGVKQLYYYHNKNIFLLGSEIKFLLAHPSCPKALDWKTSLKHPLQYNVLNSFRNYNAWFKDIYLLPEASIIQLDMFTNKMITSTYWNHFKGTHYDYSNDTRTVNDVMNEYIALLIDAIKIRANNSFVNYSLLSGGLDSSAIAALCAKHSPLETFSIITQVTYLEGTTSICNQLAHDLHFKNAQFLIPMHTIVFNADLWKQWIWRMESPDNHTDSLTKTLLHYAIRNNYPQVRAVLTGTGSDQFNGGLVRWIVNDANGPEESWKNFYYAIQDAENHKLIHPDDGLLWGCRDIINREYLTHITHKEKEIEYNSWMFYVNSALYDEDFSLLWDEVRASNYHGHITRFPFLDFRFVDFIAKIPPHLHKDLFFDKTILRNTLKNILPEYVLNNPKAPPYIPEYDYRFKLFNFLTNNIELMEEAFGTIDQAHTVINKPLLFKKIKELQQKPNIMEWNNIMKIVNLGLLEKMINKDQEDMNIEALVEKPLEIRFHNKEKTKIFLEKELSIRSREIDVQNPLLFCENCALLFDTLNNKYHYCPTKVRIKSPVTFIG